MTLLTIASLGLAQTATRPTKPRTVKSRLSKASELPSLSLFPILTIWTLPLNNQLTVPPGYDATRAYFPIEDNRLVAYELDSGALAWTASIKPEMEPTTGDGLVFVVEGKTLTALRATDGTIAWRHPLDEKLAVRPVWDNGWLVLATTGGTILAFRAIDGLAVWHRDLMSPAHAPPALAADRVYVPATNGHVIALRVDSGMPVWDRRLGGPPNDLLALDEVLYVGSQDNFLYCIDARNGDVEWRWRTGGDVIGRPVVDEHLVYFVSFDNVLRALSRRNGVQQWIRPLPLRPTTGPLLVGGTVVVAGLSPTLRGFNSDDGKPAGDLPIDGDMAAPPHLIDNGGQSLPRLVVIARDIAKGASVQLVRRSVEPGFKGFDTLPDPVTRMKNPDEPETAANPDAAPPAKESPAAQLAKPR